MKKITVLLLCVLILASAGSSAGQTVAQEQKLFAPEVQVQKDDYSKVRSRFKTKLIRQGVSPQEAEPLPKPPAGVTEIVYSSGKLRLKAWLSAPAKSGGAKQSAVLFLHGGFAFGSPDWDMVKPYADAGFVVMVPMLRGENGQAGSFSMFYDEVDDVIAAAKFLKKQPSVDPARMFLAGHSAGGTIALLAAQASQHFRAAATFDGSPDQQLLFNGIAQRAWVPKEVVFDRMNLRELQVRSPLAYATSFKCPARLYYSTEASILYSLPSQRTAAVAKEAGLDVEAIMIEGNHMSHVAPAMKQSIVFFRNTDRTK